MAYLNYNTPCLIRTICGGGGGRSVAQINRECRPPIWNSVVYVACKWSCYACVVNMIRFYSKFWKSGLNNFVFLLWNWNVKVRLLAVATFFKAGLWSQYTKAPTPTPTPRFLKLRLLHKSSICINNGKPIRHFIATTLIVRLLFNLITYI
jgi:hypothetical protein